MTHVWTRLVVSAVEVTTVSETFDAFVAQHAQLLDNVYPLTFYTRPLLLSDRARAERVEPDIRAL